MKHLKLALALAILVFALLACGDASNASSTGTIATPQATTTQAAPQAFKVGDLVKIGDYTVKVNSVKTSKGDQITTPKAGNIFLLINVAVTNASSSAQSLSSLISFKLADSTGQSYTETVVSGAPNPPDGTIAANAKATGDLAYEVPKAQTAFTLSFQPDLTSTDQATWAINA